LDPDSRLREWPGERWGSRVGRAEGEEGIPLTALQEAKKGIIRMGASKRVELIDLLFCCLGSPPSTVGLGKS